MSRFARLTLASAGEGSREKDDEAVLSPMDRRIERRLVTPRLVVTMLCALAVLALAGFGYWRYGLNRVLTVGAERLTVSEVKYGTFREYIPITGNIVPKETVYLDAVEGGQVTQVLVEEGATVSAGQPLLELKNTNLQLEMISTEARLSEQINNLNNTRLAFEQNRLAHKRQLIEISQRIDALERDLRRARELRRTGAVAEARIEDMAAELGFQKQLLAATEEARQVDAKLQSSQMQQLEEAVDRIQSNLDIARENLANLVMKAPIAGQLTVFEAHLGESKGPGQRIGQIDDIGAFKVTAYVDEFYLNRIVIGQVAGVTINGDEYRLQVTKIYPNVTDRQFQVDLVFRGAAPRGIRRGQTLRMNLEIGAEAKSLILANGAFVDDTGGQWVFVLSPDGDEAVRRNVSIGRRNPDMVEVTGGLTQGEKVITSGYDQLMDFDRIDLAQGASN